MPTLVDKPPAKGDWSVEVKFDGWRCQIVIDENGARVFTRRGHDWTVGLKIIADAALNELIQMNGMKKVRSAIIDGELVYPHQSGRSDFHALQAVVRSQSDKLLFMAFDLLHINGEDLRGHALEERRDRLRGLIPAGGRIQFSEALEGAPAALYAAAERMALEGIVCKRRGSPYRSGNAFDWLKVTCFVETELELLGVQREPGKSTIALMGAPGTRNYVGSRVRDVRQAGERGVLGAGRDQPGTAAARLQGQTERPGAVAHAGRHWPRPSSQERGKVAACDVGKRGSVGLLRHLKNSRRKGQQSGVVSDAVRKYRLVDQGGCRRVGFPASTRGQCNNQE